MKIGITMGPFLRAHTVTFPLLVSSVLIVNIDPLQTHIDQRHTQGNIIYYIFIQFVLHACFINFNKILFDQLWT